MLVSTSTPASAQESFHYTYDASGQLFRVIDSSGTQIQYDYDEVGNILAIQRTTVGTGLQVLGFSPARGGVGTRVTVQGQGFAADPASNALAFNGVAASVLSVNASGSALTALVPPGATSGPISLMVGASQAMSSEPFTVVNAPVISDLSPTYAFPGETVDVIVHGFNLANASFALQPQALVPTPSQVTLAQSDGSATLELALPANAAVGYVVVATGPGGDSGLFSGPSNTLRVLLADGDDDYDDLSNAQERALGTNPALADSDGDGYSDSLEAGLGSSPLDASSVPLIAPRREVTAFGVAVVDDASPARAADEVRQALSLPVAIVDEAEPIGPAVREAASLQVAAVNEVPPAGAQPIREAISENVAVQNSGP